jgi:hypothetical protein
MREQLEVGQEINAQFIRDGDLVEFMITLEEMPR